MKDFLYPPVPCVLGREVGEIQNVANQSSLGLTNAEQKQIFKLFDAVKWGSNYTKS